MLQKNNLLGLISDPIHKPVTLFWPTDTAIRGLPQEQQDFLFKKANTDKLVQYLKFHIVRDAAVSPCFFGSSQNMQAQIYISPFPSQVLAYQLPSSTSLKTLQGSNLSVSCGDNGEIVSVHSAGTLYPSPLLQDPLLQTTPCLCMAPKEGQWHQKFIGHPQYMTRATPTDSRWFAGLFGAVICKMLFIQNS